MPKVKAPERTIEVIFEEIHDRIKEIRDIDEVTRKNPKTDELVGPQYIFLAAIKEDALIVNRCHRQIAKQLLVKLLDTYDDLDKD